MIPLHPAVQGTMAPSQTKATFSMISPCCSTATKCCHLLTSIGSPGDGEMLSTAAGAPVHISSDISLTAATFAAEAQAGFHLLEGQPDPNANGKATPWC